jgi:hypothetical protein
MTDLERATITIDTLTKHHRSALDSARDHQRNALQKEVRLCEAKQIMRRFIDAFDRSNDGGVSIFKAIEDCKEFLLK